ncbi:N-acetylglucosamine-specific PTS transporter subunit IIBC [Companilactobacillus sp. DQM5]|uniref:N-acetylglucosamine-specific PTS transporter subunit IIBC n=1 Tax=Companilactobacillus sp. DQM5 TaxID=3463359 RepID=UPI00405814E3
MKDYLQRMGRSLQLPVAVLPAAALLQGIGHMLPQNWAFSIYLQNGGTAILGSLAILFAVGLSFGMSEDQNGAAALAGLVAYLVPTKVLAPTAIAGLWGIKETSVNPAFGAIDGNVLIGIVAGLIAAAMYNKFHKTKLPMALSFFSGKRSVPIITAVVMLVFSGLMMLIWPPVYDALVVFGKSIVGLGAIGAGIYGFFNRLLIPTGLHQALNSVFWFDVAGINDIAKFWSGHGVKGVTGMFQAGFFPVMMFGLPAGAFVIYKNARPEKKKEVASLMMAAGFASFFTGVTEPLEFSFMFVAWPLYVLHALFTGLSLAFAAFMHWTAGFSFSAGLVDYILSFNLPLANKPYMLIIQGLVMAVIYYFGFNFAIKKFNLMTPGREETSEGDQEVTVDTDSSDDKYTAQAKKIYAAIGGYDNIDIVDNCTTRLRLTMKDTDKINEPAIKSSGAAGVSKISKTNLQIIIGTEVEFVADALKKLFKEKAPISSVATNVKNDAPAEEKTVNPHSGQTDEFYTVADGKLVDIESVNDATFSQKMLGDGYAVIPTNGKIVAPVDGEVVTVFPTKHAVGFKTENGLEVLLHMGIDTVELNGEPFDIAVEAGQKVKHGDVVANVDLDKIKKAKKDTAMMVIVTNMSEVSYMKFSATDTDAKLGTLAVKATIK